MTMHYRLFRTFFTIGLLAIGLSSAVLLTGCGASSDDNPPYGFVAPSPSPVASPSVQRFTGTWSGPFTLSTRQTGLTEITISDTGTISGLYVNTATDAVIGNQSAATGNIDDNGNMTIQFTYNGTLYSVSGVMVINSSDQLTGTLNLFIDGKASGTVQVTLSRGSLPRS